MAATKEAIQEALKHGHTVDITTTGRKTGEPRRIEIVFHNIEGRIYISGTPFPRKRRWLINLEANPEFTFHLKGKVQANLSAKARVIEAEAERRVVLPDIAQAWGRKDLEKMVRESPLIEVTIDPDQVKN